jgi:two-component system nitrogen regulation response regulator GlnG
MAAAEATRTVLVVDDEAPLREMLVCFFETKGYRARAAGGAEEALDLISQTPPQLVILDIRLPGMNGLDALKRIKKLDERLPVLLMTGYATVDSAVAAMKLGALDYIAKPIRLPELLRAVENAIAIRGAESGAAGALPGPAPPLSIEDLMGRGPEISRVYGLVGQVARTDLTVIVYGETGAGKSLVAGAIHGGSRRAGQRFVRVDCGAIPDTLIESELFGHERGAFTGAFRRNEGYFELANGGTLFLDEIANLSEAMMRKLLCALEDRRIYRVGGKEPIDVDIRVVAASNQNLEQLVEQGRFRRDLFHRLNEFVIEIPPLRKRRDDIPFLVERFVNLANAEFDKNVRGPSQETMRSLIEYGWPGNARELRNVIKRAVLLCDGVIRPEDLRAASVSCVPSTSLEVQTPDLDRALGNGEWSLKDITRECVRQIEQKVIGTILGQTHGNKSRAARILNVDYKTLYYKAKELGY